jgi:hypothetical protein
MKVIISMLFLIGVLFSCTFEPENPAEMDLTIRLLGNPQCIYLKSPKVTTEIPESQSCIEFAFDRDSRKLMIKHIHAAFNCCPESLWCTVTYRNDTIIIQEFEKNMGCKCNCLYDLDLELLGIDQGKYKLILIEPYLGTQQSLVGTIDLWNQYQGSFCVSRNIYPWKVK